MINSNLDLISRRFRKTAAYTLKLSTKCCGQTAAYGDMVTIGTAAYKKSPAPYPIPMVPLPTPFGLPFSHNAFVTDRQTTPTMPLARP